MAHHLTVNMQTLFSLDPYGLQEFPQVTYQSKLGLVLEGLICLKAAGTEVAGRVLRSCYDCIFRLTASAHPRAVLLYCLYTVCQLKWGTGFTVHCPGTVCAISNLQCLMFILSKSHTGINTVNIVKAEGVYSAGYSLGAILAARQSQLLVWDYKRMIICGKALGVSC